jgi:hypothetical protein
MQRQFAVRPSEPIGITNGGKSDSDGKGLVLEHISFWDPQSDLWVERDVAALIGCKREGGRIVRKLSAFNYFTGMTGKGGARAPVLYNGKEFRVDVYNLEEEQNGFHRGCDEDEIWFQFRGHSLNHTEWGAMELDAGQMSYIPRGVATASPAAPDFSAWCCTAANWFTPRRSITSRSVRRASMCSRERSTRKVFSPYRAESHRVKKIGIGF